MHLKYYVWCANVHMTGPIQNWDSINSWTIWWTRDLYSFEVLSLHDLWRGAVSLVSWGIMFCVKSFYFSALVLYPYFPFLCSWVIIPHLKVSYTASLTLINYLRWLVVWTRVLKVINFYQFFGSGIFIHVCVCFLKAKYLVHFSFIYFISRYSKNC